MLTLEWPTPPSFPRRPGPHPPAATAVGAGGAQSTDRSSPRRTIVVLVEACKNLVPWSQRRRTGGGGGMRKRAARVTSCKRMSYVARSLISRGGGRQCWWQFQTTYKIQNTSTEPLRLVEGTTVTTDAGETARTTALTREKLVHSHVHVQKLRAPRVPPASMQHGPTPFNKQ